MRQPHRIWPYFVRTVLGCLLIGMITFVCYRLQLNLSITGFIYLIVVVLQSLVSNFASSAVVSVVAVLCLDFFFVPPLFSFEVTNSLDILALTSFLTTGPVITRLTTRVREAAAISNHQRHQVDRLYQLAQRLLALDPEKTAYPRSIELFQEVLGLRAVCLFDATEAEIHCTDNPPGGLADQTRSVYSSGRDNDNFGSGVLIRCLHAGGNRIGAIAFAGLQDPELTAGPLSALAAALLERVHTFRSASHSAAAAQAELFRGAVLDALAHEFKTPLATIVTAAGGLRELGPLAREQLELTDIVETEASRLSMLTSRLLQIARLIREEVKPHLESTDIAELVTDLADQYAERWPDRKFSLTKNVTTVPVLADAELLRLALRQLLDNACKYSQSGSAVTIGIELQHELVTVRVWNRGNPVSLKDRAKMFERFYRGAEGRDLAPGSGLGLYVARKIAKAHGGDIKLEDHALEDHANEGGNAFRLTIPVESIDSDHARRAEPS
jgi:two-component system sensor histidine kinase KdpD